MEQEKLWLRTWIEISKADLYQNYRQFRQLIGSDCRMMAVAKSNAYGHSLVDYSRTMQEFGIDWIGVDSIVEARTLREHGITVPILVLGYTIPIWYEQAAARNVSLTISNFDSIRQVVELNNPRLKVHLKVDTGMHRQGFRIDEVERVCQLITAKLSPGVVEGIYTHFAAAKNPEFPTQTQQQLALFRDAIRIAASYGITPMKHAAATAGAIVFPESHFDLVRIGIGLMGLWPSFETKACFENNLCLKPVLSWKTIISETKTLKKGETVGYDFTEAMRKDSVIAILPVGYWHGYRRSLSSVGQVLVRGQRAKVIGRVSMDMICIDVTDIPGAQSGDVVTLLGRDGGEEVDAYELARLTDTSWYETITQINPLIKKFYV